MNLSWKRSLGAARAAAPSDRASKFQRALLCLGTLGVAAVVVGGLLQVHLDTTVRSFVPDSDPAFASLEAKARSFGDDPILVVAQTRQPQDIGRNGALLLQFLRLEGQLSRLHNVSSVYGPGTVLNQIATSAQDFLAEISGRRDALQEQARLAARRHGASAAEANRAADRAVQSFDLRYGSLLVQALPAGLPTLSNEGFVTTVLYDSNQKVRSQWRFIVPNDNAVVVLVRPRAGLDQADAAVLVGNVERTVAAAHLAVRSTTVTGVPVVTSALSSDAQREFPLISIAAVLVVGCVFIFAPWTRRRRARLVPLGASLAGSLTTVAFFGWTHQTLSLGVVAFLPILMGIGSDFPYYLITHGLRRPVVVASLAAAGGFSALTFSALPFVRELGVALALGILLIMAYALVAVRFVRAGEARITGAFTAAGVGANNGRRRPLIVLTAAVLLAAVGWALLPSMQIEARPEQIARGLPQLVDAEKVEAQVGSSGELDVMLTGRNALSPAALAWSREAETRILARHSNEVRAVVTSADMFAFLGKTPTVEQVEAGLTVMPSYLTKAVVRPDQSASLMIFGVRLNDLAGQGALIADIRRSLPPTPSGLTAQVVGLPVLTARAVAIASEDRVILNLAGLGLAVFVVAVGLGRRAALKVLATGLLATGLLLGAVALFVGSLNPLTVAIGSLVTATATEFSVLYDAVPGSPARRHRVIGTAALAGVVGFLTLTLSRLAVLRDFGVLLAVGVACSFMAAAVIAAACRRGAAHEEASAPEPAAAYFGKGVLV